ncbi:UNVERIFIED_CONTAM: hypothetical protein GTU68_051215 [Idotea baltica]|nr:hypothetical protein [Idotea baltica]
MEELVADPIEEELYQLEDIKKIESTIKDGLLVMLVEFNFGVNVDNKNNDITREINKLRGDLPDGLVELNVERASSSDVAILQTALVSETASMQLLNDLAEDLEKRLERIRDIKWVDIQGVPDQELRDDAEVPEIMAFSDELRKELEGFAGAKVEVRRFQQGTPLSAPIEMRVIGNNLDTLERLSAEIEYLMNDTEGSMYVRNDLKYEKSEIGIRVDKDKAGMLGLTTSEVAKTVRLAMAGLDVTDFRTEEGDEFDIRVSILQNSINPLENFERIYVTSLSGALVPLQSFASISLEPAPPVIRHYNKERYSLVSSFVQTGYNTDQMTDEIISGINNSVKLPKGYRLMAAGERLSREESFGGIGTIIILTVFGLLGILILEFRTFKSTIIVLSVIPMGFIGALIALWIAEETLSFVATIGIIALAGIEVKNSILMVDYTNGLREKGMKLYDAVMDGAETRFLPILLTSLTAIGGMTPLVLERSPLISPLAMVLIGGLISSTLLSRLVTPVLYYLIPPKVEVENADNF